MQIDWITVVAQIANFLVLVWILQRLLYRPVVRAMDRRAAAIRARFDEAARREAEAAAETERLQAERQALAARRDEMLRETRAEAQALREQLETEAREAVAERRRNWEEQLDREQATFLAEVRREAATHVARLARRVLGDLASAPLEAAIADSFIDRLRGLKAETLDDLRAEAEASGGRVHVTSAFDLPEDLRARLLTAVRETLDPQAEISFARDPDLICGIRLRLRGKTLQWSVDAYLDELQQEISATLEREGPAEAAE